MYYGQEQHLTGNYSPYNRQALWETGYDTSAPLYKLTSTLNRLRNHAIAIDARYVTSLSQLLYSDPSTYAARKGPNGPKSSASFPTRARRAGNIRSLCRVRRTRGRI